MLLSLTESIPFHKHTCLRTLFHTNFKGCISLEDIKASLPTDMVESWHPRLVKKKQKSQQKGIRVRQGNSPSYWTRSQQNHLIIKYNNDIKYHLYVLVLHQSSALHV